MTALIVKPLFQPLQEEVEGEGDGDGDDHGGRPSDCQKHTSPRMSTIGADAAGGLAGPGVDGEGVDDGKAVAELRPLPRPRATAAALIERFRRLPCLDPDRFRADVDAIVDQSL